MDEEVCEKKSRAPEHHTEKIQRPLVKKATTFTNRTMVNFDERVRENSGVVTTPT
jgi:hypothetical protein